jgi:hypothetical protein
MNAPLMPAHSPFGGSVARRVLRCPASVGLTEKVPAYLREVSAYAERGTALHEAMVHLIDESEDLESLVGQTINNYTITQDDVENALRPVYAYVAQLIDAPGAEFYRECRVAFPTVAGAFGTVDLLVRIGSTVYVVDYKFGAGVRVLAQYPDGDEDVVNAQPMFYAAGARYSLPKFLAGVETINLTILQPQSIEPNVEMVSTATVTHVELDEFITVYRAACAEALSDTPHLARGDWCRFCDARPICPAHAGPLLDLAALTAPTLRDTLHAVCFAPAKEAYLNALATGLAIIDNTKDMCTALRAQAKAALENGDVVPGYSLTPGRAERRWRDDASTTLAALESLGLTRDDVVAEEMRSVKQVEARARARSLRVPQELIVSSRSGTSLVRSENARAPGVPGRDELARSFAGGLVTFQGGRHT